MCGYEKNSRIGAGEGGTFYILNKEGVMKYVGLLMTFLVSPALLPGQISWTKHLIDDNYPGPGAVYASDIDGDSMVDVLAASIDGDKLTWWKNEGGYPVQWTGNTIDSSFNGACDVKTADVDGDGDTDVVAGGWYGHEVAWWEQEGSNPIVWTKHSVDDSFYQTHEVFATDMDGDEDIDILGASAFRDEIAWWENDGQTPISWAKHIIDTGFDGARSVHAVDVNGDSLPDVFGAALLDHEVSIWYNNGDFTWTKQKIDSTFNGAHMVYACDVDRDGDWDVLAAGYLINTIAWWRNEGAYWSRQIIDSNFATALDVYAADLDNDEDIDVMGTSDAGNDVSWWENMGSEYYVEHLIDGNFQGAWPIVAEDLDGDGDRDILAGANGGNDMAWWENNLLGIGDKGAKTAERRTIATILLCGRLIAPEGAIIVDAAGRIVQSSNPHPGVYFAKAGDRVIQKIIKLR
jgi:hypothetical protein